MLDEPLLEEISQMHTCTGLLRDFHKSLIQGEEREPGAMTPAQNNPARQPLGTGEAGYDLRGSTCQRSCHSSSVCPIHHRREAAGVDSKGAEFS